MRSVGARCNWAAGAEIFVGDQFDMRDLRRALVDVQRAYHTPPFAPNLVHGAMMSAERQTLAILKTSDRDRPSRRWLQPCDTFALS